jgi:hypothetical protein
MEPRWRTNFKIELILKPGYIKITVISMLNLASSDVDILPA